MSRSTLQSYIDAHQLEADILMMEEPTPTVPDAARVLGIECEQVIKSLVFKTPQGPVLVVATGESRVDSKKLARQLQCSARKVRLVRPETALELTGYIVGSMPPFGHLRKLPTYVDDSVLKYEVVYGGGGELDAMLRLCSRELIRVTEALVLELRAL